MVFDKRTQDKKLPFPKLEATFLAVLRLSGILLFSPPSDKVAKLQLEL